MKKPKSKKFRISMTIVALVEIVALIAAVTFSWIEGGYNGDITSPDITITTGSDLSMYFGGNVTNSIIIPQCTLEETSSADGRNFFFPLAENQSNETSEMTFREGTADDENKKYVSLDFELVAGDNATDVYLGTGTIIQSTNANLIKSLRMSFLTNDNNDPKVFSPKQMPGVSGQYFSPITAISESGAATTTNVNTEAYGDYYYNGDNSNVLFHLKANETKHITLVLWLEGTEFSTDDVADKALSVYVEFTTNTDDLTKYNFVDNTHGVNTAAAEYWITNTASSQNYDTMMYIYDKSSSRYYAMTKSDNYDTDRTWTAYVPNTISSFSFRRYSIDIDKYWNQWNPSSSIPKDPNGEYTYVAITDTETDLETSHTACYGYWKSSQGKFRVFCEVESGWDTPYCYGWNSTTSVEGLTRNGVVKSWPGEAMTYSHTTTNGKMYYYDLYETDNIDGFIFNSGGKSKVTIRVKENNKGWNPTKVYAWNVDTNEEYLGNWSGTEVNGDLEVSFWVSNFQKDSNTKYTLGVIASNNGSDQTGDMKTSDFGPYTYTVDIENSTMTKGAATGDTQIKFNDSQYFFNGFTCWFKSDSENGTYIYTGTTHNLISK